MQPAGATARDRNAMKDKPYAFALMSGLSAVVLTVGLGVWAAARPEAMLIGLSGRHDGSGPEARLATCLDCHVPFAGTPGSRCLGPGCHGELATGSPPRDGPAMPIRFHVALRDGDCSRCHREHGAAKTRTSTSAFAHARIPEDVRRACARCHRGAGTASHASTDSVACDACHATSSWKGVTVDHDRIRGEPCDLCHIAPTTAPHASIAGACKECHSTEGWHQQTP